MKGKRENLAETDRGSCYNHDECLEEFLDNEGAFFNGSKNHDSGNDDENYNRNNEKQQLSEGFASSS